MKYVCLVYNEEREADAMSVRERDALAGEAAACDDELRRRGHLIAAHALEDARTATTVRVRNGRLFTTEGPAAGASERLRGVLLITARDLNEAIQVASQMPAARWGSIEVRPTQDADRKDR